jgi:hypothetical protein
VEIDLCLGEATRNNSENHQRAVNHHFILWNATIQALNTYNGSWIYNCLCNQWLSPRTLRVRTPLRRCVLDRTLCDKDRQWFAAGRWFPPSICNKVCQWLATLAQTKNNEFKLKTVAILKLITDKIGYFLGGIFLVDRITTGKEHIYLGHHTKQCNVTPFWNHS